MQVYVKIGSGKVVTLSVVLSDKTEDVKLKVRRDSRVDPTKYDALPCPALPYVPCPACTRSMRRRGSRRTSSVSCLRASNSRTAVRLGKGFQECLKPLFFAISAERSAEHSATLLPRTP